MKGFDELARQLDRIARNVEATTARLNRTAVETPLLPDENGFIDRSCPSCALPFKIAVGRSGGVRACPSCGHKDPDARWETEEQREQAMANAKQYTSDAVRAAFSGVRPGGYAFGRGFFGSPRDGVNVVRDGRWVVVGLPARAGATLRSERTCAACNCRFSFIGSAFFCPGCGISSAEDNFDQSLAEVRRVVAGCRVLGEMLAPDEAAIIVRALLEKAIADLVTSFQMIAETLYQRNTGTVPPLNAFQRLEGTNSGHALWVAATGRSYADYLTASDREALGLYFQRRHLLAHRNGFVEQRYLDRSGDTEYAAGQRLIIEERDVTSFARIIETLERDSLNPNR
jgi:uncharacterized Zn finger protein (UPF0148 family)